ncbi:helix-turn-helix domain-containing protein [Flavobacterium covae]|uniref:helix-turn-helix domain-containing protein n=1 Tax=Flavobacterium covae TaxID=2906076 RepID=UPI003392DF3D
MLTIVCCKNCILQLALRILLLSMINNSDILKKFGEQVRQLRLEKGISQEELASRASLHRTYIGMIERAEKNITLVNIAKIAKALETSISKICDGI